MAANAFADDSNSNNLKDSNAYFTQLQAAITSDKDTYDTYPAQVDAKLWGAYSKALFDAESEQALYPHKPDETRCQAILDELNHAASALQTATEAFYTDSVGKAKSIAEDTNAASSYDAKSLQQLKTDYEKYSTNTVTAYKDIVAADSCLARDVNQCHNSKSALSYLRRTIAKFVALYAQNNADNRYDAGTWSNFAAAYQSAQDQSTSPKTFENVIDTATILSEASQKLVILPTKENETISGISNLNNNSSLATVQNLASKAEHFSDRTKLTPDVVKKLEDALMKTSSSSKPVLTVSATGISNDDDTMKTAPDVSGLLLAAGYTGEGTAPAVTLNLEQIVPPSGSSNLVSFTAWFAINQELEHNLLVPVTIKIHLPASFVYHSDYAYKVHHVKDDDSTEELPLTITGTTNAYVGTFTTNSFSDFTVVGTAPSSPSIPSSQSYPVTQVTPAPSVTFVSDTTGDFDVNGAYTFRITSKDGKTPTFTVDNANAFDIQLVKQDGNDYYFKITAVGAPGAKAGIYVNGTTKLLVATVKSNPSYVKSDTTGSFQVKAGKSYVFKLTGNAKPTFVAGTGSAFDVSFVKQIGKDYFFKATAVGKAGKVSGFYVNHGKTSVAVATVA